MNPSVFLAIVLSIFFSVAAFFYLLGRLFFHPRTASDDFDNATALQRQLQQLFLLHDSGVDLALIDALPIFLYKSVVGFKHPFDCAVCLTEFHTDDKLRLLTKCCHAFHLDCIDTWLMSHSTCPLCRGSLLPDFGGSGCSSPAVGVLELGGGSSREIRSTGEAIAIGEGAKAEAHVGFSGEGESSSSYVDREDARIVSVKLGKFRSIDVGGGSEYSSSNNCSLDGRKCFSMGSVEYVLDESSVLQVAVRLPPPPPLAKHAKQGLDASLCTGIHHDPSSTTSAGTESDIQNGKRESFSVSKMWFRSKKINPSFRDSARRAFSFRLPMSWAANNESRAKQKGCGMASEAEVGQWGSAGEELGLDVEVGRVSGRSELASKGHTAFAC
ncbi:hypothetical protein ACLOJK_002756 [Asimina triloba]